MEHPLILSFCQTWQLYAGLTHSTNSNNHLQALSSTQAVFSSPAVSTVTNRQISSRSPPNVQGTDANKERKKSTETRQARGIFINLFFFLPFGNFSEKRWDFVVRWLPGCRKVVERHMLLKRNILLV